jgi:hypothetical protein
MPKERICPEAMDKYNAWKSPKECECKERD